MESMIARGSSGLLPPMTVFLVLVWAATTRWYFWPVWPALGLSVVLGTHWLIVVAQRIEHLESARAGAVAVQETDLRRIEHTCTTARRPGSCRSA